METILTDKQLEKFTDEVEILLEHYDDKVTTELNGDTLKVTLSMNMSEYINGDYENSDMEENETIEEYLNNMDRFGVIQGLCFEFKKMITSWGFIPKEVK